MKLFTLLLSLTVFLFLSDFVSAQSCQTVCFSDFNPVCGSTRRGGRFIHCNFSNQCEFNKHRCLSRESKGQIVYILDQ